MSKSLMKNAMLMTIKTIISLLVPLLTFPYVSRVLQVEAIGKYNFSASIVSYFILMAEFGISTYSLREATKIRDDKKRINEFYSEIFLINIISTIITVATLITIILNIEKLKEYALLIIILATQIIVSLYGRSWIYSVYEDFTFITLVQIFCNLFSVLFLFLLVKTPKDLYAYAWFHVISSGGANVIYGLFSSKYVTLCRVSITNIKKHIKPLLIIWGTSIATIIYVNSDITILGWVEGDKCVGLYSTSVRIYNLVKQVIVAVITVAIPRLSWLVGTSDFKLLFRRVFGILLTISLPVCIGLLMTSKEVIVIIAGVEYLDATFSLQILSVALVFALVACLFGTGVLLPNRKEKIFLASTIISAVINVFMNFVLIPFWGHNAAAFTTVLSQCIAFLICFGYGKKYIDITDMNKNYMAIGLGCIMIFVCCFLLEQLNFNAIISLIMKTGTSVFFYVFIQMFFKNEFFLELIGWFAKKLNKYYKKI